MKKINILGVGNALVDKQFLIEDSFLDDISIDKGTMGLCESNYQEELYKKLSKHYKKSQDACGGSATNTIFAASSLGSSCGFIGKVANDTNGHFYKEDLEKIGIQNNIISEGKENTGTCLIMISPDAERTMSTCLGISADLNFSDIDYAIARANTTYGVIGVKIWIFKGEILGGDQSEQDLNLKKNSRN